MISLQSLYKFVGSGRNKKVVLSNAGFVLPPGKSGIIYGLPRAGKTTLAAICAGLSRPNSGKAKFYGKVSIPISTPVAMTFGETAKECCYVLSRLYCIKRHRLEAFVEDFAELQGWMDAPLRSLSIEQRVRLIYAIGFGLPADLYLVDGQPYRGSGDFAEKCRAAFQERRRTSPFLCITGDLDPAILPGAIGGILRDGGLETYDTAEEAALIFSRMKAELAVDRMEYARGLLRGGKEGEAVLLLEKIVEDEPDNSTAFELLSKLAWRGGDFERVMVLSDALVRLGTADVDTHYMRARAAERSGSWEEAVEAGEAVLRLEKDHKNAAALVARCYEQMGDHDAAARIWLALANDRPGAELNAGLRCLSNAGNWPDLLDLIERIAQTSVPPEKRIIEFALRAAVALEQPQRAIPLIAQLAHQDPAQAFVILTAYRTKLGWLLVARSINQIRSSGGRLATEGRGYDIVYKFLNQARPTASKADREQEAQELERALECLTPNEERVPAEDVWVVSPSGATTMPEPEAAGQAGLPER